MRIKSRQKRVILKSSIFFYKINLDYGNSFILKSIDVRLNEIYK